MTSSSREIEAEIIAAINASAELREVLKSLPGRVAETVQSLTPVRTGETEHSIEATSNTAEFGRLSTRPVQIGSVFSDDPDQERIASIEYGRDDGEHGKTEEHGMFRRAAAIWNNTEL